MAKEVKGGAREDSESVLEQAVYEREDSIRAPAAAPERFEIEPNLFGGNGVLGLRQKLVWRASCFPFMQAMRQDINRSFTSLDENPSHPKTRVTDSYLRHFEAHATSLGVGAIGYTRLPTEAIFRGKAVLFDRVIVLTMEMDAARMDKTPSRATLRMVMKTYYQLGQIITTLVETLRHDGYAAQAGHPLNGVVLYPLLGQRAGLGWCGSNGLLISPQFGPRQRIGVIFTSIQNLPLAEGNDHAWIERLCARCGQCSRKCPGQAILPEPIQREPNIVSRIDVDKCFPVFAQQYGCSICIKVCPFHKHPYERIKRAFLRQ